VAEERRLAHDRHEAEARAAEQEKERQREERAAAERERRRQAAEAAQALPPTSSRVSPAPWPAGEPLTGTQDLATRARREAEKHFSLGNVSEHAALLREQEKAREQEAAGRAEALHVSYLIQRGD
jgi:hypothetical protein